MSQLAQRSPHLGAGPSLRTRSRYVIATSMRRNTPRGDYSRGTYKIDRTARPTWLAELIVRRVAEDGGEATFIGFGRWAGRLFGKVRDILPTELDARLVKPTAIGAQAGQKPWTETRHAWRLIVTHKDRPATPPPHALFTE